MGATIYRILIILNFPLRNCRHGRWQLDREMDNNTKILNKILNFIECSQLRQLQLGDENLRKKRVAVKTCVCVCVCDPNISLVCVKKRGGAYAQTPCIAPAMSLQGHMGARGVNYIHSVYGLNQT